MKYLILYTLFIISSVTLLAQENAFLDRGELIYSNDFNNEIELEKFWMPRHCKSEKSDGVLKAIFTKGGFFTFRGIRVKAGDPGILPDDYIISYKFKVIDSNSSTNKASFKFNLGQFFRFIDLKWNWKDENAFKAGIVGINNMIEDNNQEEHNFLKNTWYKVLIEKKADKVLFSVANGPQVYIEHPQLNHPIQEWAVSGPSQGEVHIDDFKLFEVKSIKADWVNKKTEALNKANSYIYVKPKPIVYKNAAKDKEALAAKTNFLLPNKLIYKDDFNDREGKLPVPTWGNYKGAQTQIKDGIVESIHNNIQSGVILRSINVENGGLLPENYIVNLKIKIPNVDKPELQINLTAGHQHNRLFLSKEGFKASFTSYPNFFSDKSYPLKGNEWLEMILEKSSTKLALTIVNGPTYYIDHEFLNRPKLSLKFTGTLDKKSSGITLIDDVYIWSISDTNQTSWNETLAKLRNEKRVFIQSENPHIKPSEKAHGKKKKKK